MLLYFVLIFLGVGLVPGSRENLWSLTAAGASNGWVDSIILQGFGWFQMFVMPIFCTRYIVHCIHFVQKGVRLVPDFGILCTSNCGNLCREWVGSRCFILSVVLWSPLCRGWFDSVFLCVLLNYLHVYLWGSWALDCFQISVFLRSFLLSYLIFGVPRRLKYTFTFFNLFPQLYGSMISIAQIIVLEDSAPAAKSWS